jgi:CBS domain-containing protein
MDEIAIENIMESHLVSVSPSTTKKTALKLIEESNISLLPVVEDQRLVGVVTEEQLREKALEDGAIETLMKKPLFLEKGKSIDDAIKYLMKHSISRVPVVESTIGMKCVGIVSASELLKAKKSMQK